MRFSIGVLDYGMGNLHSVAKALSLQDERVIVSDDAARLDACRLLVVPGVGSFGAAMTNLKKKKLDRFVRAWTAADRPYLGICLGLQLLFERSEEDPSVPGLGVLKGRVAKFRPAQFKSGAARIPHMGWNSARPVKKESRPYFKGLLPEDYFYFVHSYYPAPADASLVAARTLYGNNFCSAVQRGPLFACQYHPEKSGEVGLTFLNNVVELAKRLS